MAIIVDKDGNVVTVENEPEDAREMFPNISDFGVRDVLINGTSIVDENGDAEIPIATTQEAGVILVGPAESGLEKDSGKFLKVLGSTIAGTKYAIDSRRPVTPSIQHGAAFYGLAKAAGDTTQALSDNEVGSYTDEAKASIRKMLDLEIDFELIKEITTDSALTELEINTDNNNNSFKLKELILIATLGTPTTSKTDTFNSSYKVRVHGASEDSYMGNASFQYPSASSGMKIRCQAKALSNAPFIIKASHAVNDSTNANEETRIKSEIVEYISAFKLVRASSTSSNIPVGSTFKMYGIRYSE